MGLTRNEAIGVGFGSVFILWLLWRTWKVKRQQNRNRGTLPFIRPIPGHRPSRPNHQPSSSAPLVPPVIHPPPIAGLPLNHNRPIPLNAQQQRILNHILTPTILRDDLSDTSRLYADKIIDMTPEHQLLPLQVLDEKFEVEQCIICLDNLKCKGRPVVKLACEEHYFHYSCYETFLDDDNKKKEVELLFGESKHIDDMYSVNCPICRKKTTMALVYINYPDIQIPTKKSNSLDIKESYISMAKSSYSSAKSASSLTIQTLNVDSDDVSSDGEYRTVDEMDEISLDESDPNETTPLFEHK